MALYNGSEKFSSQIGIAQYADVTDLMKHMTIEVGDVGQVMLPLNENENKRRYLNGQAILQEQFPRFTAKLKAAVSLYPSLACTEAQWQAKRLADPDDQCAKFVIDDVAGTIRLPRVKFLCGNLNLYKLAEGIPNRRVIQKKLPTSTDRSWYVIYNDGYCEQGNNTMNIAEENHWFAFEIPFITTPHVIIGRERDARNSVSTNTDFMGRWDCSTTGFRTWGNWNGFRMSYTASGMIDLRLIKNYTKTEAENDYQFPYYIQVSTGVDYEVDVTNHITTNLPYSFGMIQRTNNKLNNISWLQSDGTFHNGNSYPDFYQWLLREKNNPESDITVKFNTDSDITEYDYVINTSDTTFKLPTLTGDETVQSQDFLDLTSQHYTVAGTGTTYTAPYNGYFYAVQRVTANASQCMGCYNDANYTHYEDYNNFTGAIIHLGPFFMERGQTMSDIRANVVGNDRVVRFFKAKSGYKYLYFYVGETMQDANLINVGRIVEAGAQLTTLVQLSEELGPMRTRYVVEKWENGTNGYMIYNDNYCVQYGVTDFTSWTTNGNHASVSFFKEMADTNYQKTATMLDHAAYWPAPGCCIDSWSTTGLNVSIAAIGNNQGTARMSWRIEGYMAQE